MFLGQEVHYYMVYIAYFTELILQICDYAQKRRIWSKKAPFLPIDLQKVRKWRQILIRDKIAYVRA